VFHLSHTLKLADDVFWSLELLALKRHHGLRLLKREKQTTC
jgi:hypothetical protein